MEQTLAVIISLLIVLSAAIIIFMLPEHAVRASHSSNIRMNGDPADADVLSVEQLKETDNGVVIMSVRLRVYPTNDVPYETHTDARIWRVDIPHLQPGRKIPVWIDPHDREKVAVDLETA